MEEERKGGRKGGKKEKVDGTEGENEVEEET